MVLEKKLLLKTQNIMHRSCKKGYRVTFYKNDHEEIQKSPPSLILKQYTHIFNIMIYKLLLGKVDWIKADRM